LGPLGRFQVALVTRSTCPATMSGWSLSQFPYATVTPVTPEYYHEILLTFPVILSLYTTQSAHTCPWTYVDTLESRACPHPHMVTCNGACVHLCAYTYCLAPYCLLPSRPIVLPSQHSHHTSLSLGNLASFLMGQTSVNCICHSIHLLTHLSHFVLVICHLITQRTYDVIGRIQYIDHNAYKLEPSALVSCFHPHK
jgi:hypothetical protein